MEKRQVAGLLLLIRTNAKRRVEDDGRLKLSAYGMTKRAASAVCLKAFMVSVIVLFCVHPWLLA